MRRKCNGAKHTTEAMDSTHVTVFFLNEGKEEREEASSSPAREKDEDDDANASLSEKRR